MLRVDSTKAFVSANAIAALGCFAEALLSAADDSMYRMKRSRRANLEK
jgi:hypothetical protein